MQSVLILKEQIWVRPILNEHDLMKIYGRRVGSFWTSQNLRIKSAGDERKGKALKVTQNLGLSKVWK